MTATNKESQLSLFVQNDKAELPLKSLSLESNLNAASQSFSKHIVYVDESGDHGMRDIDSQFPVFVLAFCVFHKGLYSEKVVPALEKFKFKHFGHDQIVLHESEIRKEKGSFRIFPSRAHRESFLDELTSIISRPIGLNVFRASQTNRAFEVLKKKFFCAGGRKEVGMNYEGRGLKIYPPSQKNKRPR